MAESNPIPIQANFQDLTGQTFGRLTVVAYAGGIEVGKTTRRRPHWMCRCSCGVKMTVRADTINLPRNCRHARVGSLTERFWRNVNATASCWIWEGSLSTKGYGKLHNHGKALLTHRLAYELLIGPIPNGKMVCHHCDNPCCVCPSHLFLGDPKDNTKDMVLKQRHEYGSERYSSKLSEIRVLEILHRYQTNKATLTALAREYSVSKSCIWNIVNGYAWNLVTGLPRQRKTANKY